ncbi:MAG: host-nuclease inhibitor Gam family protein [Planctomycetes bacterium]|nr:host-nuclease inhibitor Gam family protein [Planctomycetota bacterium]
MSDVRLSIATAEAYAPAPQGPTLVPEYQDEERPEVKIGWSIGSEGEADWAFERIQYLDAHIGAIEEQEKAAIARIQARAAALKEVSNRGVMFFSAALMEYGEREKKALLGGGKKKSRTFLHGTIGWRKKGGKLTWIDEAATLNWAKSRPVEQGLYRVKYELEKKAIQDATKAENIIPPGCELEPETDEVYVKATKGEV